MFKVETYYELLADDEIIIKFKGEQRLKNMKKLLLEDCKIEEVRILTY